MVEQFTPRGVLGDQEKKVFVFEDLVKLGDVGVSDFAQDFKFQVQSLLVGLVLD